MRRMIAILCALAAASPVHAKQPHFVISAPVADKPTVKLDTNKAYILVRTAGVMSLYLMRQPSPEDQKEYDGLRAAAFAKARKRYARDLELRKEALDRRKNGALDRVPDQPVEPTEETFVFASFGEMAGLTIGPVQRFAKSNTNGSTYLQEVTPGDYRLYGPMSVNGDAAFGTCFCMGSVAFTAKAGEIVDLGGIGFSEGGREALMTDDVEGGWLMKHFFTPLPAGASLDPRLAGTRVVAAKFRPVGKVPNYYGVTIARIPPIDSVLRYDRDRIVDLTNAN